MSLLEQRASVAIGFAVALVIQLTLLPAMGIKTTYGQDFIIVAVFTVASIIRGYIVRRAFNWWHFRQGFIVIPNVHRHRIQGDYKPLSFASIGPTEQAPPPRPPAKK